MLAHPRRLIGVGLVVVVRVVIPNPVVRVKVGRFDAVLHDMGDPLDEVAVGREGAQLVSQNLRVVVAEPNHIIPLLNGKFGGIELSELLIDLFKKLMSPGSFCGQ